MVTWASSCSPEKFDRSDRDTQTFAIGLKELWELPFDKRSPAAWCTPRLADGGRHLRRRLPLPLADNQVTLVS